MNLTSSYSSKAVTLLSKTYRISATRNSKKGVRCFSKRDSQSLAEEAQAEALEGSTRRDASSCEDVVDPRRSVGMS